jgi:hypothetical protein
MRLCTFLQEAPVSAPSSLLCPPATAQACNMLHMPPGPTPQAPSSISGGKEPAKHPGFIVPQKEGTNYLPTLWSAQGKNRSQWVERVGNGGGGVQEGRESHRIHFKVSLAIWRWDKKARS